jgi:hypothetical protein
MPSAEITTEISAVAVFGFGYLCPFAFDVGTGQVIQQHVKLRLEQILPALPQTLK